MTHAQNPAKFPISHFGSAKLSDSNARHYSRVKNTPSKPASEKQGKWQLFRDLADGGELFGLSDRCLAVLEALWSFHGDTELDSKDSIVVWPSNAVLASRARGMAPATLRRHLAVLVERGFIRRKDSPNGKRFARRDEYGQISEAFGFDLSLLVLRADEVKAAAVEARRLRQRIRTMRDEITLYIRDIRKIAEALCDQGRAFLERLMPLAGRLTRAKAGEALEQRHASLSALCKEAQESWLANVNETYLNEQLEEELSATDAHSERHIQNSNTNLLVNEVSKKDMKKIWAEEPEKGLDVPDLGAVLAVCPTIVDYARDGRVTSWRDFFGVAQVVRGMIGVSPDAWNRARAAMGDAAASVVVAAILERSDVIRSPGGYLRVLTERAEQRKFTVQPMLRALMPKMLAKAGSASQRA